MSDDHEKEQVDHVFRLTGGELADKPWKYKARRPATFPPEEAPLREEEGQKPYWYEGVPEYAKSDFEDSGTYRTVVQSILFGHDVELVDEDGATWKLVEYFTSSGETECPGKEDQTDEKTFGMVTPAHTAGGDRCVLCDEKLGDEHGYIYLGDGWAELVYRLDEPVEEEEEDE